MSDFLLRALPRGQGKCPEVGLRTFSLDIQGQEENLPWNHLLHPAITFKRFVLRGAIKIQRIDRVITHSLTVDSGVNKPVRHPLFVPYEFCCGGGVVIVLPD